MGAIIVAAGLGQRMGGVDKIFAPLLGRPLVAWAVDAFETCPHVHQIVLVVRERNLKQGRRLVEERGWGKVVQVCPGGRRRQDSVARGLEALSSCQLVAIHDGARPLITGDVIRRGIWAARRYGAAVAAVPVTDTIKVVSRGLVVDTPERDRLWAVQTPQVFQFDIIDDAYRRVKDEVTDDASLVERLGHRVRVFMGSYENIKVTTPRDLALAEAILGGRGN
ncbi:MAG: 2-C-methyl-D-erythritol 4-phosphate cytidylyltransferase [Dehalococcoidia bacterium]